MDKIKNLIEKKGSINMSDYQMILFELEMNKKIEYKGKNITFTPLTGNSEEEYKNQQERIIRGDLHMWDDTKENNSKEGDFFAYVVNPKKDDKYGYIYIYKILKILEPKYALSHWNCRDRNILILNSECLYQGYVRPMFDILKYKENYRIQKTMKVSESNYDLLQKYFESIF